ncbi:hypothetical protein ABS71_20615 [bacterium SCN 62-11]|nr:hypothetical protein [Candidatus Eremiobacteraeota bacterium]ODT57126.1 MAG: hypothetical protein ABS71_20615 [bacterium SCN 62-11]
MNEQDVLRYLLRMPGERAALLILLSALSLEPAPDVGAVMEVLLNEKRRVGAMEWASSVARINLRMRQRLDWELATCERLLSGEELSPSLLVAASRALLQGWQKTAPPGLTWEPDSEAPAWHDLSQPARLKLVRVFLGLLAVPLNSPYEPEPAGKSWTVRFLATMFVGASVVQRGALEIEVVAGMFGAELPAEALEELSEIVGAAGASERQHVPFAVRISENWFN